MKHTALSVMVLLSSFFDAQAKYRSTLDAVSHRSKDHVAIYTRRV
jgi:hypothetical protein